jgi:hypothetical protein
MNKVFAQAGGWVVFRRMKDSVRKREKSRRRCRTAGRAF